MNGDALLLENGGETVGKCVRDDMKECIGIVTAATCQYISILALLSGNKAEMIVFQCISVAALGMTCRYSEKIRGCLSTMFQPKTGVVPVIEPELSPA